MEKSGMTRKRRLISKFMTSQFDQKTIKTHILPNILRSEGKQTMKLGQVIGHGKRNIFLQKSCRKWGRGTISRPLLDF